MNLRPGARSTQRHGWFVGLAWGGAYLAFALAVLVAELISEHDKLNKGTYTDTFDALVYARLVTLPAAFLVAGTAPNDRGALNDAAWQLGGAALGQAVVIGAVAVCISWLGRSPGRREHGRVHTSKGR